MTVIDKDPINLMNPNSPMGYIPLLKGLPAEKVFEMINSLPQLSVTKDRMIYFDLEKGDKFYFLLKGNISLFAYNQNQKKRIFEVLDPGDNLGEAILFDRPYQEYAQVIKGNALVALCYRGQWENWVQEYPKIQRNLSDALNSNILCYKKQMMQSRESVYTRLMMYLKYSIDKRGIQRGDEIWVTKVLTHDDIASFIGATRQTVTLAMSELKQQQKIEYNQHCIIIKKALLKEIETL